MTRIDRHLRIDQPVELEAFPTPEPRHLLDTEAGIEDPLPCRARDDEGKRHGIEVDRAKDALGLDALIHQDREDHAEHG
jgi:hypothetical protein